MQLDILTFQSDKLITGVKATVGCAGRGGGRDLWSKCTEPPCHRVSAKLTDLCCKNALAKIN